MEIRMSEAQSKARSALGLLGRKVGMTRIFTDDGESVPVTVLDVSNNRVTQVRTAEVDGYSAVQVAFGSRKPSCVPKPLAGHYAKAGVEADRAGGIPDRCGQAGELEARRRDRHRSLLRRPGRRHRREIGKDLPERSGGTTSSNGPRTATRVHQFPGSDRHAPGPGRVFPGKRMAGHLGDEQRTTQNLVVARIDAERGLLLVRGAVPGAAGGNVIVRPAAKAKAAKA
jgi:large subunit ribosomal protein L3